MLPGIWRSLRPPETENFSALAWELEEGLDCAVLAMRYSVGDEFAARLTSELYDLLLDKGQPLSKALQTAMRSALEGGYNASTPPISLATPTLCGGRAADLAIKPPKAPKGEFQMPYASLVGFEKEREHFVGRSGPLGQASAALALDSQKRGVLFYGMAGAGKTACALELAHHYHRSPRFQGFVWYSAPEVGRDISGALGDFALAIENKLKGIEMVHLVDRVDEFEAWLPTLSEFLENNSILIVLDNIENLLTSDGDWRDKRWGPLVKALLDHNGYSRLIVTSRRVPKDIDEGLICKISIHALSLNESVLLAREMPNLGRLLAGKTDKGRELVVRTLELVQGHPKLIELAEGQAGDPEAMERYLEASAVSWGGDSGLDRFFSEGKSAKDAEEFMGALRGWTKGVSSSLPNTSQTLFRILCAIESGDRLDRIVKIVWPMIWKNLGLEGLAPEAESLLGTLRAAGLMEAQNIEGGEKYSIHPEVAEAGLDEADKGLRVAVDSVMADFWQAVFYQATSDEGKGLGQWVVRSCLSAAPYLMRQKRWGDASLLLEEAIYRDKSPGTVASVLPMLRHIAEATKGTDREIIDTGKLAVTLLDAGRWQEAEGMMRSLIPRCKVREDFRSASVTTGYLLNILSDTGRYEEALELVEDKKSYTSRAGLGPWSQLSDEVRRLQILNKLGRYDEVLEDVDRLKGQMRSLPEKDQDGSVVPWNVMEVILDTGCSAAVLSEKWGLALSFNADQLESKKARGATDLDLARTAFKDYGPLLNLERNGEAAGLLWHCQEIFEKENYVKGLGAVFSALADLEYCLGHLPQGLEYEQRALRYKYIPADPSAISASHNNMAIYLSKSDSKSALAHRLASAIIKYQTGSGQIALILRNLNIDLNKFGDDALSGSFDEICTEVEKVEGVHFRELFEWLPKRAKDGDEALGAVVGMFMEMLKTQSEDQPPAQGDKER